MTTYANRKLSELKTEIKEHVGYGESKIFYKLREEMIEKLGTKEWERLLSKAKVMAIMDFKEEKPVKNNKN